MPEIRNKIDKKNLRRVNFIQKTIIIPIKNIKIMLTQDQKQKFIACLEQKMKVKLVFQWEDFLYFQYIGCSETGGAAAYIAGAKDTARIPMEKL